MAGWWTKKRKKSAIKVGISIVAVAIVGYVVWLLIPQNAQAVPLANTKVLPTVMYTDKPQAIVMTPALPPTTAILFYPGARIDPAAYAYKLSAIVQQGAAVIIAKPLFHFALLDATSAATYKSLLPNVANWYVAGHSVGGVKACQMANDGDFKGLILFGAYCSNDLSKAKIAALSVAGANDQLSTTQQIDKNKSLLPTTTVYRTIIGLNHAGFGNYGSQAGDGTLAINDDDARQQIAQAVTNFLGLTK